MNQIILIGRLTRDPELRYIPQSGTPVARFSIAVNREFKREGQADADFFKVVVWGKSAESAAQYLAKGRLVGIQGNMRNNNYEDKNGVKHYENEVVASRVEFLEWDSNNQNSKNNQNFQNNPQSTQRYQQQNQQNNQKQQGYQQGSMFEGFTQIDDDIPF